ncbi:MAG: HlyD family efflux transporter periplasmic adaptor subunit [Pseudomonadota bacterium]|nr:HlyD family efflux transporter periplasmic adaptor subunit [Pseudomonadota bacterium]
MADQPTSTHSNPTSMRVRWHRVLLIIVLLLLLLGLASAYWYTDLVTSRHYEQSDHAYIKADVAWVLAAQAGEITELAVQEQDVVDQHAFLLSIDDTDRTARRAQLQALAQLKSAALQIHQQSEQAQQQVIRELQGEHVTAQAELARLQQLQQRYQLLYQEGLLNRQTMESNQAQRSMLQARLSRLSADIHAAEHQYEALVNRREQLQAEQQQAQTDADALPARQNQIRVHAPVAGRVNSLNLRVGSRVDVDTRLMSIVPLDSFFLEALFTETQIERMQVGQRVEIEIDAYPDQQWVGYITGFLPTEHLPPLQNSTVRRLPVRIDLDRSPLLPSLRPGLAANLRVDLRSNHTTNPIKNTAN